MVGGFELAGRLVMGVRAVVPCCDEGIFQKKHQNRRLEKIELFRCGFLMHNETMIYGYARVSTAAQDESGQVRQLKAAGCEKIFREKITGTTADRPQLGKLMKKLAPGDVVITPTVDRLSRDTTDLLVIAREMKRAGAGIRSLAEPFLDTTSDFAEIVFAIPWRCGEARTPPHSRTHRARPGRRQGEGRQIRPQANADTPPAERGPRSPRCR